jgi:hypothetical protein
MSQLSLVHVKRHGRNPVLVRGTLVRDLAFVVDDSRSHTVTMDQSVEQNIGYWLHKLEKSAKLD